MRSNTRLWWDGNEVDFVCWTDRALMFCWRDASETAVQIPRGAVMRLIEKGVLHIEGSIPNWDELPVVPQRITVTTAPAPAPRSGKASIVSRLIRRLTGSNAHDAARVTG